MKEVKPNSFHAWFLAARPKTLTGAIIPVLLGSALAVSDGLFKSVPALLCLLFACGMQIAANFINDLSLPERLRPTGPVGSTACLC